MDPTEDGDSVRIIEGIAPSAPGLRACRPDELAGRALGEFLQHTTAARKLGFIGMGSSQELQSDRVDELLAQGYES